MRSTGNRHGDPTRDEYYTPRATVEAILGPYGKDYFTGMRVLCPCDGDGSEYVRYLREHGAEVTYGGRYEDYDFEGFDFIATNPPFSCFTDFARRVISSGTPFNIICPLTAGHSQALLGEWGRAGRPRLWRTPAGGGDVFCRPDGTTEKVPACICASAGYPGPDRIFRTFDDEGREIFDRSAHVPSRWAGQILVPTTFPIYRHDGYRVVGRAAPVVAGRAKFERLVIESTG